MNMKLKIGVSVVFLCLGIGFCPDVCGGDFVKDLATPDSVTGAMVTLHQDARITRQVTAVRKSAVATTGKGFRVQLFASNVSKKGRDAAFQVEKKILAKYPDFVVYVTYAAPFWKVRVGDCISYEDAAVLRAFMVEEFPEYRSEIYIVPDQINVLKNE